MQTFWVVMNVVAMVFAPLLSFCATKQLRDSVFIFLGICVGTGTLVVCWYFGMNDEHLRDQYDKINLRDKTIKELNYSLSEAKQKLREYEQNADANSNDIASVFSEKFAAYRESSDIVIRSLQTQLEQERKNIDSLAKERDALNAEVTRLNAELERYIKLEEKLHKFLW